MQFKNHDLLSAYLEYVDDTESPRIMHLWSLLSAVAASVGRRVQIPFMDRGMYLNMYILLCGGPGLRKSTAIDISTDIIRAATSVRLAPDDTAGQRQGLISAIHTDMQAEQEIMEGLELAMDTSLDGLVNGQRMEALGGVHIDLRDRHSMYVVADEFTTFIGTNNSDMLTFLLRMYDGRDYDYQLKSTKVVLKEPLLNILTASTPTSIAQSIPPAAMGQGFMSRMILVYADKKHKRMPIPKLKKDMIEPLKEIFGLIYNNWEGLLEITPEAAKMWDDLYDYDINLQDPRFTYYQERRHPHLKKLSGVLAVARLDKKISAEDVEEAHKILCLTERVMPDALGEYGLSPLSASKQRLVEFITSAREPVSANILWNVMHREMKRLDFTQCLADLQNAGKIMMVNTSEGPAFVPKAKPRVDDDLMQDLVKE